MPENTNPKASVPPSRVPNAARQSVAALADIYLLGNPAALRMPSRPISTYPELQGNGFYSDLGGNLHVYFEEILEKDGHIFGILGQRWSAVLARDRVLLPASNEPRDMAIREFVEACFKLIQGVDGGFNADLEHLLYGIATGLSILEIDWQPARGLHLSEDARKALPKDAQWIVPRELLHRYNGNFVFDREGRMYRRGESHGNPELVPDRKYLQMRFGGAFENPYGRGLLQHIWWYYFFKKAAMTSWSRAADKWGTPTVIATRPDSIEEEMKNAIEQILDRVANDMGAQVPESVKIDLLEAGKAAHGDFRALLGYCDDSVARCVLGSTLTSSEGERSGSLALGQVHFAVARDKVERDAEALMHVINEQLIRWIVDINFGTNVDCPRWQIDISAEDALTRDLEIDTKLINTGVSLPKRYFYEHYRRPVPGADEAILSHDDQNLFQYHLQYSTVTLNEARMRLGLPEIPGGNVLINTGHRPAAPDKPAAPAPPAGAAPSPEDPDEAPMEFNEQERGLVHRLLARFASKKKALPDPWR